MFTYNPKEWFKPLYRFHKADTFRKLLPLLAMMGIYSAVLVFLELRYFNLGDNSPLKHIPLMHSLLSFAIALLLVFRTNTAYDRWWEGRKLWGSLVNNSRNLTIKMNAMLPDEDDANRLYFGNLVASFASELRIHLMREKTRLELDSKPHPEIPDFDRSKHVPNQIVGHIQKRVAMLVRAGILSEEQVLIMNPELISFLDICGACERIKNTPIPYSYSAFIKKFIFIYVLTLPLGYAFTLHYLTVPVVMFIFYVLASLELIAEEIEDPFGADTNDLPMDKIAQVIRTNVSEILE